MAKKNETMHDILISDDKLEWVPSGVNGIPAALFRRILRDINITGMRWSSLMSDFITNPENGIPDNRMDQTSRRGNLMKELARRTMSWKVFCKALRVIQFMKVDFIVRGYHRNGRVTEHQISIDFSGDNRLDNDDDNYEDDEDDYPGHDDTRKQETNASGSTDEPSKENEGNEHDAK